MGEGALTSAYISPVGNLWNPGAPWSSDSIGGQFDLRKWPHETSHEAFREYADYVGAYRKRDLFVPSDALNAFKGLQNILQHSLGTDFWYRKYLETALLWTLVGPHKRQAVPSANRRPTNIRFPSWSWAGWSDVDTDAYFLEMGLRREIRWFLINRKAEAILMQSGGRDGTLGFPQSGNEDVCMLDLPFDNLQFAVQPRDDVDTNADDWRNPEYLACSTALAVFHLTGKVAPLGDHGLVWPGADNLEISNGGGQWVGSILMSWI